MNFQTNHSLPTSLPLSSLLSLSVFLILFYLFFSLSFLLMHLSHAGTPAPCGSGRATPSPFVSAVSFAFSFFFFLLISFPYHHYHLSLHYSHRCFLWFAFDYLWHMLCPFLSVFIIMWQFLQVCSYVLLCIEVKAHDMLTASSLNLL